MLWQVRTLLEDRPGALAALAACCGRDRVNILGLQIFPAADGRVLDEMVLHTPGGWSAPDVEGLCERAGVADVTVAPCTPQALEDQPVRYLRAARVVTEAPELLEDQLCRVLDAVPADGAEDQASLLLDDGAGPSVRLARGHAFTDTERARAAELRHLAAAVGAEGGRGMLVGTGASGDTTRRGSGRGRVPSAETPSVASADPAPDPAVRLGSVADVEALVAMHGRCSAETVFRRYHSPMVRLSPRLARALLTPADGFSIVVGTGDDVVAAAVVGAAGSEAEAGIMVEDRWQRRGLGARLLRALAEEAAARGTDTLTCHVQPDNDAVLRTIHRAELRARVSRADGLTVYRVPVRHLRDGGGSTRRRRPAMGRTTTPLVALLNDRRELREVHPVADLIDQAVRGGA